MRNCELEISLLATEDERRDDVMIKEVNEESLRDFCRFPLRQREPLTLGNRLPIAMTTVTRSNHEQCVIKTEKNVYDETTEFEMEWKITIFLCVQF